MNFQSANSLKQQFAGRYVDLLGHINGKATITSFLVLGMTRSGLEHRSTTLEVNTLIITPSMRFLSMSQRQLHLLLLNCWSFQNVYVNYKTSVFILSKNGYLDTCQNVYDACHLKLCMSNFSHHLVSVHHSKVLNKC